VLADVRGDKLTMVSATVRKNVLDKVVAKLVAGNCLDVSHIQT